MQEVRGAADSDQPAALLGRDLAQLLLEFSSHDPQGRVGKQVRDGGFLQDRDYFQLFEHAIGEHDRYGPGWLLASRSVCGWIDGLGIGLGCHGAGYVGRG